MTKEEMLDGLYEIKNWKCNGDAKMHEVVTEAIKALEQEPTCKNDLALIHTEGLEEEIRCTMCTNYMKSDRGCDGSCVVNKEMYQAVMDSIEKRIQLTTRNDLGVDCISRKRVLEWLENATDDSIEHAIDSNLEFIPSVTLQEPRWIPVSERLPDTEDEVLCWHECYHWSQKKVLPEYSLGRYSRETSGWFGEVANGKDVRVIAWMPLPKPYEPQESEG